MNMHLVNACKQWRKYRCSYVLQVCHKRNTLECTMICAHDEEYENEYLHGNNLWNISRSVYVAMQIYWYLHALKPGMNT